jgi:hypothetical protein
MLRSRHSQFAFERQRFTRRRLMGSVTGAGVRVLRCTYVNSLLLPVALAKFRVWEPLLRKPPASGVNRWRPGSTSCCTRRWRSRRPGSAPATISRRASPWS